MTDLSSGALQLGALEYGREDSDPAETAEWLDALDAVVAHAGRERAQFLFDRLAAHAQSRGVEPHGARITPYVNTISFDEQQHYPGDLELEERLDAP
jgi:pyruvate dehydrogenase E1 component